MTKAMKTMPNSQAQKEIIKQVNVYRKKLGLFALKEEGKDIPLSLYDLFRTRSCRYETKSENEG